MKRLFLFLLSVAGIALVVAAQDNATQKKTLPFVNRPFIGNAFTAVQDTAEAVTFRNPVIAGFFSDPSVCRVGEDYYLVTSTFEYFPGVPLFHSRDLVNWELIGHCIERPSQLPGRLDIYAATIRYFNGQFYMITTDISGKGNFFVTASNPAGPWSDPYFVKIGGIDPDLFLDDDGKAYVISSDFILFEIDLKSGRLLSEGLKIWNGAGGRYPEGPHIYQKDGFYYLMSAEGGTEEAHSEIIARSKSIWGPYNANPANPIITQVGAAGQGNPIQGTGHADIIQAHDGSWWTVFHGYRTVGGGVHHILGRETCLAPVSWPENGWPSVNGNGTVSIDMTCATLPLKPFTPAPSVSEFDSENLGAEWNYIRYPEAENYSLAKRKGALCLMGSAETIEDHGSPTFVGRRLQHMYFDAVTSVEFYPGQDNEEAGIILLNNGSHFDMMIKKSGGKRVLLCRFRFGSVVYESREYVLKPGPVDLKITGEKTSFAFSFSQNGEPFREVDRVESRFLSSETVGGFTGVYVGLYATGNGSTCSTDAVFERFGYAGK